MQYKYAYLGIGSVLTIVMLLLSDPSGGILQGMTYGSGTVSLVIKLLTSILYVGVLYLSTKVLLDFVDLEDLYKKASRTSEGAGSVVIGIGLMIIAISIVIYAATN